MMNAEQAVEIIEAVGMVVDASTPETVTQIQPEPNYWWLLALAIIPVWFGWWLNRKKRSAK
jgi:hypothetical protein